MEADELRVSRLFAEAEAAGVAVRQRSVRGEELQVGRVLCGVGNGDMGLCKRSVRGEEVQVCGPSGVCL